MLLLSAVDPNWGGVVYGDLKDGVALSFGGLEAREDATIWLNGHTGLGEGRLDDGVVLGEIVEIHFVSWIGSHDVRRECQAILTNVDINGLC